ncbi:MAG: hypothetical protein R2705_02180 [Ilumatobacteraceae bacterium]
MPHLVLDTPIGRCRFEWNERGFDRVSLGDGGPSADPCRSKGPDRPEWVEHAVSRVLEVLHGARDPLADVPVDLTGVTAFDRSVYEVREPSSRARSGRAAPSPSSSARARSRAGGREGTRTEPRPADRAVPPSRGGQGRPGGFSAPGGTTTKLKLLALEGAPIELPLF